MFKKVAYGTQEYVHIEQRPYVNRFGVSAPLDVWMTKCADCGAEVEIITAVSAKKFEPNRRCRSCIDKRRASGKTPSWYRHKHVSVFD